MLPTLPLNAPKILVVDDSWTYLSHIANVLTSRLFAVITAVDGEDALHKAAAERPDCIVMDVIMPKLNGFQTCRTLRRTEGLKHIPIILMSSKNTPADRSWGVKQGADIYLGKPFDDEELLASIRSLIWKR